MNITHKIEHKKVITYSLDAYELHLAVAEYIMARSNQHGVILAEDITIKLRHGDLAHVEASGVLTVKAKEGESF
jgi:hypothetical protein